MALKLNGTNSVAAPAYAGDDADTGLQCGTNELKLVTGGTARATVDSSGRVGIGTSSPSDANSNADDLVIQATGSGAGITIFSDTNNFGNIFFGDSSSAAHRGRVRYDHTNDALTFSTSANERCRILSGGGLTFNGDTAQANALDDYEEGTFEPTFTSPNGDFTSVTYHADTGGTYIKIGKVVHVHGCARCTAINVSNQSQGDTLCIGNLPFDNEARNNGDNADPVGSVRTVVWGAVNNAPHALQARQSTDKATLLNFRINNVTSTNLVSQASSMMIQFSLTYKTT